MFSTCNELKAALRTLWQPESESVTPSVKSDSATTWTVACQAPLPMGFFGQEEWNGQPFPSPGDLRNPGFEPGSPALQADSLLFEPPDLECFHRIAY